MEETALMPTQVDPYQEQALIHAYSGRSLSGAGPQGVQPNVPPTQGEKALFSLDTSLSAFSSVRSHCGADSQHFAQSGGV
eukprot:6053941-Prorocentrum_lima.AAC.1